MIPEFTVSPKLLKNMLSTRVAKVFVILVEYVMFGNNEFVVSMSKKCAYAGFSVIFKMHVYVEIARQYYFFTFHNVMLYDFIEFFIKMC